MTAVTFFGDQNVVAPTHVALASTLAHWQGRDALDVYMFQSGWSANDVERLHRTAAAWPGRCRLNVRKIDLARMIRWKAMYGSLMPYGRLLLPKLLPDCDRVIYLDVDVIVQMDLCVLAQVTASLGPVCAIQAWDFKNSHDAALAQERGIALTDTYYHSGALVLDLAWCRKEALVQQFLEFGDQYASRLRSHDQTVLNLVLHGQIAAIPQDFTTHLYPVGRLIDTRHAAVHSFCGSPKPFDPMGNFLNSNYAIFNHWLARTDLAGWSPNNLRQLLRIRKNLRLLRPMMGTALKMLQWRRPRAW